MIAAFQAKYPGVQITLTQGNSNGLLTRLHEYGADIGALGEVPVDDRLLVIPLRADPMVAFVRKDHKWAKRRKISLVELSREPLVLREAGSAARRITDQELACLNIEPTFVLNVEGREASREAVAAGLGVGIVSQPEFGHDERLTSIALSDCKAVMTESIVCLKTRADMRIIAAFLNVARAHLLVP